MKLAARELGAATTGLAHRSVRFIALLPHPTGWCTGEVFLL